MPAPRLELEEWEEGLCSRAAARSSFLAPAGPLCPELSTVRTVPLLSPCLFPHSLAPWGLAWVMQAFFVPLRVPCKCRSQAT